MSDSPKVIAISIGIASTRATYLGGEKVLTASAPATWPDLTTGLSEVTKKISKLNGGSIAPEKTILVGSAPTLEALPQDLKAEFVSENDATTALERALTQNFHHPVAILDLGASAYLDHYPAEEIGRWLTFASNLTDLENYLANRTLFPRAVPVTEREYEIDTALARQAIIKLGERDGSDFLEIRERVNLVLLGGLAMEIKNQADLASLILDSFYFPDGATVHIDRAGNLLQLGGTLAAGVEVPVTEGLTSLGTFLHLGGTHKLTVEVGSQRLLLLSGEMIVLPVGQETAITVTEGKFTKRFDFGGEGKVYLDNRPRPLGLAPSSRDSAAKILAWRKALHSEQLVEGGKV